MHHSQPLVVPLIANQPHIITTSHICHSKKAIGVAPQAVTKNSQVITRSSLVPPTCTSQLHMVLREGCRVAMHRVTQQLIFVLLCQLPPQPQALHTTSTDLHCHHHMDTANPVQYKHKCSNQSTESQDQLRRWPKKLRPHTQGIWQPSRSHITGGGPAHTQAEARSNSVHTK